MAASRAIAKGGGLMPSWRDGVNGMVGTDVGCGAVCIYDLDKIQNGAVLTIPLRSAVLAVHTSRSGSVVAACLDGGVHSASLLPVLLTHRREARYAAGLQIALAAAQGRSRDLDAGVAEGRRRQMAQQADAAVMRAEELARADSLGNERIVSSGAHDDGMPIEESERAISEQVSENDSSTDACNSIEDSELDEATDNEATQHLLQLFDVPTLMALVARINAATADNADAATMTVASTQSAKSPRSPSGAMAGVQQRRRYEAGAAATHVLQALAASSALEQGQKSTIKGNVGSYFDCHPLCNVLLGRCSATSAITGTSSSNAPTHGPSDLLLPRLPFLTPQLTQPSLLTVLDLCGHALRTHALPTALCRCRLLRSLLLSYNDLGGDDGSDYGDGDPLPGPISGLVSLRHLGLAFNPRMRRLPTGIGACRHLCWLDVRQYNGGTNGDARFESESVPGRQKTAGLCRSGIPVSMAKTASALAHATMQASRKRQRMSKAISRVPASAASQASLQAQAPAHQRLSLAMVAQGSMDAMRFVTSDLPGRTAAAVSSASAAIVSTASSATAAAATAAATALPIGRTSPGKRTDKSSNNRGIQSSENVLNTFGSSPMGSEIHDGTGTDAIVAVATGTVVEQRLHAGPPGPHGGSLEELPPALALCSKLTTVLTDGCSRLLSPPQDVCARGTAAVLRYLRALLHAPAELWAAHEGSKSLEAATQGALTANHMNRENTASYAFNATIALIGDSGAGKSTFSRAFCAAASSSNAVNGAPAAVQTRSYTRTHGVAFTSASLSLGQWEHDVDMAFDYDAEDDCENTNERSEPDNLAVDDADENSMESVGTVTDDDTVNSCLDQVCATEKQPKLLCAPVPHSAQIIEFGGYPIFAHVHQHLIPPRALRVLVWDSSAGRAGIAVLRRYLRGWAISRAKFALQNVADATPPALLVVATRADAFNFNDNDLKEGEIDEFQRIYNAVNVVGFGVDFDIAFEAKNSMDTSDDSESVNMDDSDESDVEEDDDGESCDSRSKSVQRARIRSALCALVSAEVAQAEVEAMLATFEFCVNRVVELASPPAERAVALRLVQLARNCVDWTDPLQNIQSSKHAYIQNSEQTMSCNHRCAVWASARNLVDSMLRRAATLTGALKAKNEQAATMPTSSTAAVQRVEVYATALFGGLRKFAGAPPTPPTLPTDPALSCGTVPPASVIEDARQLSCGLPLVWKETADGNVSSDADSQGTGIDNDEKYLKTGSGNMSHTNNAEAHQERKPISGHSGGVIRKLSSAAWQLAPVSLKRRVFLRRKQRDKARQEAIQDWTEGEEIDRQQRLEFDELSRRKQMQRRQQRQQQNNARLLLRTKRCKRVWSLSRHTEGDGDTAAAESPAIAIDTTSTVENLSRAWLRGWEWTSLSTGGNREVGSMEPGFTPAVRLVRASLVAIHADDYLQLANVPTSASDGNGANSVNDNTHDTLADMLVSVAPVMRWRSFAQAFGSAAGMAASGKDSNAELRHALWALHEHGVVHFDPHLKSALPPAPSMVAFSSSRTQRKDFLERELEPEAIVILDPQWLAAVLASVVTHRHSFIESRFGRVDNTLLGLLWSGQFTGDDSASGAFPPHAHGWMMELMSHFDLAFACADESGEAADKADGLGAVRRRRLSRLQPKPSLSGLRNVSTACTPPTAPSPSPGQPLTVPQPLSSPFSVETKQSPAQKEGEQEVGERNARSAKQDCDTEGEGEGGEATDEDEDDDSDDFFSADEGEGSSEERGESDDGGSEQESQEAVKSTCEACTADFVSNGVASDASDAAHAQNENENEEHELKLDGTAISGVEFNITADKFAVQHVDLFRVLAQRFGSSGLQLKQSQLVKRLRLDLRCDWRTRHFLHA
eukprot:g2014.t1